MDTGVVCELLAALPLFSLKLCFNTALPYHANIYNVKMYFISGSKQFAVPEYD